MGIIIIGDIVLLLILIFVIYFIMLCSIQLSSKLEDREENTQKIMTIEKQ